MADRTIAVRLQANVSDFTREMGKAQTSLDQLVKKSGDSSGAADTAMGRLAQSARLQSDAWNTAGQNVTRAGLAVTALNAAVAVTGGRYNALQQKSRAALTTLLGGAQQANAQMDKLDEFARSSPFAKDVWITAQQQMIGFGIETEKVIPYLTAINDAVAATGGSNEDISELTRIFSQVQSAAKITAVDLMQFGQRGVDAATLIGSQMGMTGAEIRTQITDGTIDASAALDALAAGMEERFGGASAAVKETMAGAFDRVKAAWRDLSASILESAIDPEGGGWFVDMTNSAADLLRAVDALPDPVKNAAGATSALAGASLLAAGGFLTLVPRIEESVRATRTLATTFPRATRAALATNVALAAFTGLAVTIATDMGKWKGEVEEYAAALALPGEEADKQVRKLAAEALAAEGVADAMEGLSVSTSLATDAALGNSDARRQIADAYDAEIGRLRELADVQAQQGNYSSQEAADADRLIGVKSQVLTAIDREIEKRGVSAEQLAQESALLGENADASEEAATATGDLASSATAFTDAAKAQADALSEAVNELADYYSSAISASDAVLDLEESFDDATKAIDANGKTMDRSTEAGRGNWSALNDVADAALNAASAMVENGESAEDVRAMTERARSKFIEAAEAMGMASDDAENLADKYGLIPSKVTTTIETVADLSGYNTVNNTLNRINGKTVSAYVAIRQTGQGAVATGGYGQDVADAVGLAGGGQARRRYEGLLHGPGTPTSDSIPAWLSRSEFVTNAAATSYYGTDLMYAMNARRIPRDYFKPLGFADGGSPAVTYSPAPMTAQSVSVSNTLDPSGIEAAVQRGLASARFSIDGRAIDVRIDHAMNRQARNLRRGA